MKTTRAINHNGQADAAENWLVKQGLEETNARGDGIFHISIYPLGVEGHDKTAIVCGHYRFPEDLSLEELQNRAALAMAQELFGAMHVH